MRLGLQALGDRFLLPVALVLALFGGLALARLAGMCGIVVSSPRVTPGGRHTVRAPPSTAEDGCAAPRPASDLGFASPKSCRPRV